MNAPDRFELFLLPDGVKKLEIAGKILNMENSCIYKLEREDHTTGNLLKMELHKDPKVIFVGYKLPHPLQHHVELYIQTEEGHSPHVALDQAISRLLVTLGMLKTRFEMGLGPAKIRAEKVSKSQTKFNIFDTESITNIAQGQTKRLNLHGRGFIGDEAPFIDDDRLFRVSDNKGSAPTQSNNAIQEDHGVDDYDVIDLMLTETPAGVNNSHDYNPHDSYHPDDF